MPRLININGVFVRCRTDQDRFEQLRQNTDYLDRLNRRHRLQRRLHKPQRPQPHEHRAAVERLKRMGYSSVRWSDAHACFLCTKPKRDSSIIVRVPCSAGLA